MNVLIVDDQAINQKLLHATLEAEGHMVTEAADGVEALQLLETQGADAVISDILMPRMDGYRLCSEVRKHKGLKDLPFIHYTATYTTASDERLSSDLGADFFLRKPAPAKEIISALIRVTGKEHKTRATSLMAESDVMKEYSARLVSKLEEKNEQLEIAHTELRQLLAHSPAVIYRLKIDGETITPVVVSDNIERLLGFRVAESMRYEWWLDSLHPKDRKRVLDVLEKSVTGDGYSIEYRIRHKDGSYHWIEDNNRMIHGANGRATEAVGVWTDITERKRAEEAMQQSEHKYRHLFESLSDAAFLIDTQSQRILDTNVCAEKLIGRSRAEILGMNGAKLFPPSQSADYCEKMARARTEGKGEMEAAIQSKDGATISVRVSLAPIELYGRDLVLALMADVTERKYAEERLREQADIINRAGDAIIIRNFIDERVTFWNNGAERLYGWSATEAIGKPLVDLIAGDPQDAKACMESIGATGGFSGEGKQRTKDGKEIIVQGRATLIVSSDGKPGSVLLMNTDITEQKKLETQLLRAQRLETIGTLASGVAHDLNNVLTPILMCAEMLGDEKTQKEAAPLVAMIEESARRGAGIVKQVLTFARGIEGERVMIKPRHLIDEMTDIARTTFPKSIEVRSRYTEDLWSIEADPTQLHQVLLNLCVNARDAMPNGGNLVIAAENFMVDENYASMTPGAKAGPHVMLRVSDTGTGMPRAMIDKIFDPFFTTKEIGKGTGLGLSTALGAVQSHGGFISVYSEIGKGTAFKVFLPAAMNEEEMQNSKTGAGLVQGHGEQILVVDDEKSILSVTKMILEQNNYGVVSANDGPEALACFAQQMKSIHLVLTDISMPYMDGVMLVRALKRMNPDLLIVASTGQGEQTGMAELQALGVNNFLSKPYDSETLLTVLDQTLRGRRVEAAPAQVP